MDRQGVKFPMIVQGEGELDRDRALVAFLTERIKERAKVAEEGEEQMLAGVSRVLAEFEEKIEHPHRYDEQNDYFAGQLQALGWSLRCAAAAFSEHPDFREDFRP
ncbi:hypothetical protein [Streptomyces sp. NPDC006012]|uniref:hypothetical protein n=1 Tax=Streptomyces sp. NPDC006012 TaxID=3364739 RepID=UPI00369B868C